MSNADTCIIVGIEQSDSPKGTVTTIHHTSVFDEYRNNPDAGRHCQGQMAGSTYVGTLDCSHLNIGDEIEIILGNAVRTANGNIFQPVKRIDVM